MHTTRLYISSRCTLFNRGEGQRDAYVHFREELRGDENIEMIAAYMNEYGESSVPDITKPL